VACFDQNIVAGGTAPFLMQAVNSLRWISRAITSMAAFNSSVSTTTFRGFEPASAFPDR
jgi:hypothetical protein